MSVANTLSEKFEKWLGQSYRYYHTFDNTMSDYEWDMLGRELSEKWDEWDHEYKHLVTRDGMFSGFDIKYPEAIKEADGTE